MTLEIVTSDHLRPLRHGFFTRRGGASSGVFTGLNCGPGSSDQSDSVRMNRARVAKALDLPTEALISLHQVHSADVVTIRSGDQGNLQADAMVSATPGLALAILTADCQPVLFADHVNGVIGAAHAGWRGALDGILENTLAAMEGLGAERARVQAVIGPSISQRAYEVGPEFLDRFLSEDHDNARFFANGLEDRYQFDLIGFSLDRLRREGIGSVAWTGHCTYSDPARFYSYRRSIHEREADYGRLISVICL